MSNYKVLFVDDEPEWCSLLHEALCEGFQVVVKNSADDAIAYVNDHLDIEGIVMDVMMPSPGGADDQTNHGLETGIFLIEQFREYILANKCPVIVVTNRDLDLIEQRLRAIGLPNDLMKFRSKSDFSRKPILLAVLLKQLIDSNR